MTRPPTEHQVALLRLVETMRAELARPPNATEVGKRLGVSRIAARKQLRALEARGLLSDVPIEVSSGRWGLTPAAKRWLLP